MVSGSVLRLPLMAAPNFRFLPILPVSGPHKLGMFLEMASSRRHGHVVVTVASPTVHVAFHDWGMRFVSVI